MGYSFKLSFNRYVRAGLLPACILSGAVAAGVACGSSDQPPNTGVLPERTKPSTKTVTVTVNFPDDPSAKTSTNSLHLWFIAKGDGGANCADLVGGATDPNAGPLGHLGDVVATKDLDKPITAKGVENAGSILVYVEAVDDDGQVDWAGCASVSGGSATVALAKARVYDCTQDGVKNGVPCDDGDPCSVGESCRDGECKGAKARDCTALDGDCSVGHCDPVDGCVKVAFNDGGACSDGLYCTTGDKCANGDCVGTTKNCDTDSGGCRVGSVCSESSLGQCTPGTVQPYGTACDDGKFCTTADKCDFNGNCTGTLMDCSASGGCSTCSETTHACTDPAPLGTFCSDTKNCTTNDQCDGKGSCVGTPRDCSAYDSGNGCTVGVCEETFGGCTSVAALDGTVCDDNNGCTTGDHCSGGYCTYTTVATPGAACGSPCNIGATCSSTYCENLSGTYASSLTQCSDGNPCTINDKCDGFGSCYAGTYATAGTPCTNAACPNGAQCNSTGHCSCK